MITPVRLARPQIILNGKDFYSELAPYFLSMEYTDNCDGESADDFQLQLADRDRRFINDWMPELGTYLDAKIMCERWYAPNASTLLLDCGRFWIDSLDFDLPEHTVTVKATSIPTDGQIKSDDMTRGWEDGDLKEIGGQICEENKMQLDYKADYVPKYKRVEQTEESGSSFLLKRTQDVGLGMKATKGKMIIYDEATMEAAAPSFTLVYGNIQGQGCYRMTGGKFCAKVTDTTDSASVEYVNAETGRLNREEFAAGDVSEGEIKPGSEKWCVKLTEQPDYAPDAVSAPPSGREDEDEDEDMPNWNDNEPSSNYGKGADGAASAQRKAKAAVRKANKEREVASVEMAIGSPLVAAGQTFMLKGVGQFDGKWYIFSAKHSIGSAEYNTTLEIRRCLKGY